MKCYQKGLAVVLIGLFILPGTLGATSESDTPNGPAMKLNRGLSNILTSPLEYYIQFDDLKKEGKAPATAFFGGVFYGTLFTLGRAAAGVLEVATFPLPIPADYQPIMQPDTAWEDFKEIKT